MSIETDYAAWARSRPALTAVLGEGDAMRWFYGVAPQKSVRPYTVWSLPSMPGHRHMRGPAPIESPSIVHDTYGNADARALAMLIDAELTALHHVLMGATPIRAIFRSSIADLPELRADGSQAGTYHVRSEYDVWYSR